MKKQTSKERKRDERKSKSAARPTRHARIMRGVVTPILGLLAVACIGLGIMNATYWKPSSQIAASAAVKGTQYIVTDPGVLPLVLLKADEEIPVFKPEDATGLRTA